MCSPQQTYIQTKQSTETITIQYQQAKVQKQRK